MKTIAPTTLVSLLLLAGCTSTTPTRETSSGYAIFDIQAGPDVGTARITEAVKQALQKNMSGVQIVNGIPPSPLPSAAPRFKLVSPLEGKLGALAAAAGQSLQLPSCEGAVMTATARDTSFSRYGERTSFFLCVMPYVGGFALNIHTTYSKASGSFSAATLGATLARTVVGDSSQFLPRTIKAIVDGLKETGASVNLVEAYP